MSYTCLKCDQRIDLGIALKK
jgi:hypothetical protein